MPKNIPTHAGYWWSKFKDNEPEVVYVSEFDKILYLKTPDYLIGVEDISHHDEQIWGPEVPVWDPESKIALKPSDIYLIINCNRDVSDFHNSFINAAIEGELGEELSCMFQMKILDEPITIDGKVHCRRAIIDWA